MALLLLAGCRPVASPDGTRDYWESYTALGSKIGYGHTRISPIEEDGRPLLRIESLSKFSIRRGGDVSEQEIRVTSTETPAGQLVRFESTGRLGAVPLESQGRVEGQKLTIETTSAGRRQSTTLDWSPECTGFFGVEQSLLQKPLQPGERRAFQSLAPIFNVPQQSRLTAEDWEPVDLPGGSQRLLRIESVDTLPGGAKVEAIAWANDRGEILKRSIPGMQMEIVRASREEALATDDAQPLDLLADVIARVQPPLDRAHQTRRVRYRVKLTDGDPAESFANGPTQSVRSLGPHEAEITVVSLRPGQAGGDQLPLIEDDRPPTDADRGPSNLVESDDPAVVKMAAAAAGSAAEPVAVALALEQYVHRAIVRKGYAQAFDTAATVARTRQGDCTEHAVLLAALLRARGIPARAAVGLVYAPSYGGFAYHMWTEAYLDGRWTALDATLGEGGIGAAHLKLTDTSLDDGAGLASLLPVAQVLGRLEISVVEAQR